MAENNLTSTTHETKPSSRKPPPITKGDGWRNSKLTKKEISDKKD